MNGRAPLHRDIAAKLSDQIVSGTYAEESLLPPERQLGEIFGVSRTVVREAVKLLESRGLVRIERGRGTVVQTSSHTPVAETLRLLLRRNGLAMADLVEVRKVLETAMAALAAERRSEDDLVSMERCLAVMRSRPGEPEGYVDADVEFHAAVARAARNPVLLAMLEPLAQLLRESRLASFSGPRFVRMRLRQHEGIYERIRVQDPEGARAEMLVHLSDTEKDLERQKSRRTSARSLGEDQPCC